MGDATLFADALGPEGGTAYRLSRAMREAFAGKAVIEGLAHVFDIDEYARAGRCQATPRAAPHAMTSTEWSRKHGLQSRPTIALLDVRWAGEALVVARAEWGGRFEHETRHWVVADTQMLAEQFAAEVCAYCNDPHEGILAFNGSCWSKSRELWKQVQATSFDDLVLARGLADEIREDFAAFIGARDHYARYGVPWKRGVLFVGPPGNGKTHCLRATIKMLDATCLYVESIKPPSYGGTEESNIAEVFARAREVSPCCLVFEDLDAMITADNRSVFLNQLDGFADSSGLLVLATTNHPEKLDPAILERPSRFDRKYHFDPPARAERATYIARWNARLDPAMRIGDGDLEVLADDTDGFSFAYLKELFVASMARWVVTAEKGTMQAVLRGQLRVLREQMAGLASRAS